MRFPIHSPSRFSSFCGSPSLLLHALHRNALSSRSCAFARPGKLFTTTMTSQENVEHLSKVEDFNFGPYKIHASEVFLTTRHSFAFVNLRPVVPGHVLVSPQRLVPRFSDLAPEEICDLWLTANRIGPKIEAYFKASSLTFAIQDGPAAGQTVPHVHIHILPRRINDFKENDEVYDALDDKEKELAEHLNLDREKTKRTFEEMAAEASALRLLFSN